MIGSAIAVGAPRRDARRANGATRLERVRVGETPAQLLVVALDRVRDRERVVVAEEDRVLQVAEVGRDRADVRRRLGAGAQPVEAREVDDAALVQLLGARAAAPIAASHSSDDERGPRASTTRSAAMPSTPVTRGHRARRVRRAPRPRRRARSSTPGSASTSRRSTHSNVVRRHAIATSSSSPGPRRAVGQRLGQVLGERDLGRARGAAARRARRARGRAAGCAAGRGTRASAAPAARRCASTRTRRRRRRASACRRVRGPCTSWPSRAHASAVPSPAIPPPTTTIRTGPSSCVPGEGHATVRACQREPGSCTSYLRCDSGRADARCRSRPIPARCCASARRKQSRNGMSLSRRGSPGRPSTRSPMTLRCICSVPPPIRLLHCIEELLLPVAVRDRVVVREHRRRALQRQHEVAVELEPARHGELQHRRFRAEALVLAAPGPPARAT